jgi:hypothetical protein
MFDDGGLKDFRYRATTATQEPLASDHHFSSGGFFSALILITFLMQQSTSLQAYHTSFLKSCLDMGSFISLLPKQ